MDALCAVSVVPTLTITNIASGATTVAYGETRTFTITVKNTGTTTATAVNVTDIVKSPWTYVANTISGGDTRNATAPTTTGLTWTVNSLAPGASVQLKFNATPAIVTANTSTTNTASVIANFMTAAITANATKTITAARAKLTITNTKQITKGGEPMTYGGRVKFTIVVQNVGPVAAKGVVVSDSFFTGDDWSTVVNNVVTSNSFYPSVNVGDIAPGASKTTVVESEMRWDYICKSSPPETNTARATSTNADAVSATVVMSIKLWNC